MKCKTTSVICPMENSGGFTIIEVLIAIAIFAVGMLAVGLMQINALTNTNSARRTTEALTMAEEQAEWLRSLPFYDNTRDLDGINGVEPYDILPALVAGNHVAPADATPYTVRWTVTDHVPIDAYDAGVFAAVAITRSKTIRVWVTPDNNANDIQAEIVFAKLMAHDFQ